MGKSVRKSDPLQPTDFFGQFDTVPDTFGNVQTKETVRQLPAFNPREYSNITNPTPYDNTDVLNTLNARKQSYLDQAANSGIQFSANVASSVGQGLANTFDMISAAKTIKGELTGSDDNFNSSLFGISSKEMGDWANGVAQRHQILEEHPNEVNLGSSAWWAKQIASSGTGVGMALEALGTTAAIEYITGGTGTTAALGKLGNLFNKIKRGAQGAEALAEAASVAKGLRSAATMYGTISRYSESRMEAQQNYEQIYDDLGKQKNEDGTSKFTEQEKIKLASEGGRRTFNLNLALLPLDILSYRTMIFNPISGAGEGLIEKALGKITNKAARVAAQFGTEGLLEGSEEGLQFIAQEEGRHYANVLGGMDNGSSFLERAGQDVTKDEFWNNFAGGVIGSPIIGGLMKITNKMLHGNQQSRLDDIHKNYISEVGKMDNSISNTIRDYEAVGKTKEASVLRRQFGANKALSAIHLDAMTDKDTAFDSYVNFLDTTLGEINAGKIDSLQDLGFNNPDISQLQQVKDEFGNFIKDAKQMKTIYDNVKDKYNKNFVPTITSQHFQLEKLNEALQDTTIKVAGLQGKLSQYSGLSSFGKEQYNAEYELHSLQEANIDLVNKTKEENLDEAEKTNISSTIEQNKAEITKLNNRLIELGKDEGYESKDRITDKEILDSALKDKDYLQAVYEKNKILNEISLKRKNLALWNDPTYQKRKTTQSIKKATSQEQLDSTQASLVATQQSNPSTEQAIQDKKNELAAEEAAKEAKGVIPGNDTLFELDNNIINDIAGATTPVSRRTDPENANAPANAEEYLFSPSNFDFDNSPDESKLKVINGVKGLLDRIGSNPSFEDLVRHVVKVQGETIADNIFNALKYGWEKNSMPQMDYQAIYDKVFGNPMEELINGTLGLSLINTPQQLQEATTEITNNIVATENPTGFDNNNQPTYVYSGVVTNEASPKMAFTSRLSDIVLTPIENSTVVSHEYLESELNTGDYVNSLLLLDPDSNNEGTEMQIEIPANFNDIKVPIYNTDGTKGEAITFGQWVSQNSISTNSQEYKDKLPMIIYRKNKTTDEKGLSFVHDIGWYHPIRFNQENPTDMANAISNTREIRTEVLANSLKPTLITITSKRQTTFAGLKTETAINLREANPETQLTIALTTDSLSTSSRNTVFPNNDTELINKSPFSIGQIFDVRRYGNKDGKKTYVAFPVLRPKLDEISKSSVLQVINIYANKSNTDSTIRATHDRVVKQINDTMGLDILNQQGLEKYLQHFINTFTTEKARANEDVEAQAKSKLKAGTPYIAFIAGGNIVFGKADEAAYVDKTGTKRYSYFINPSSVGTSQVALSNISKPGFIGWYEQNLNLENLNRNKPIVTVDKDFKVTTTASNYNDFLLDRLQTNVKSYNIGTSEKPNRVTNIQPVITYELNSKLKQTLPTNEEVKKEILHGDKISEQSIQEGENLTESDIERIVREAKEELGKDFGVSKDTEFFAPSVLSIEQRELVSNSINRIAGLTPDQQHDITDFMYNQIIAMVNLDNKIVTRNEVDSQVSKAFDEVIKPLKTSYVKKLADLNNLLSKQPELSTSSIPDAIEGYRLRIDKINAIEANFDVLKQEAFNKVSKYTGITESTISSYNEIENTEENSDNYISDEPNEREVDFWTDVLQENPESKLSHSMRRFFEGVKKYDKEKTQATGFLGLPAYTGSTIVIRTLMTTLADTPSDFTTMLNKLKERTEAIHWMQEVINKLEGADNQRKNQFVTMMSNTSLRMKFTMLSHNQKTNSYTAKVYDTNLGGIADTVKQIWMSNFYDSELVKVGEDGNYSLNKNKAKELIQQFQDWKGVNLPELTGDLTSIKSTIRAVKNDKPITFTPTGNIAKQLKEGIIKSTDRMQFSMSNFTYQINSIGNDRYQISFINRNTANKQQLNDWLESFGITISDGTLDELTNKGLYHNYVQRKPIDLLTTDNGLYQILYNNLTAMVEKSEHDYTEYGGTPIDETVIKSLANLESKYNNINIPFGFRDNGKSLFALTAPKFITDRARELKTKDGKTRAELLSISFSQNSLWLKLLGDNKFKDQFNIAHIGLNAFKQLGKKLYRDNGIMNLSDTDHELTKLGMFWDTTQGEVSYNYVDGTGITRESKEYPGTSIALRMATVFSPTMSDKSLMTLVTTGILNLKNKDLLNGIGISDDVKKAIYEQTVRPELQRMVKFYQNGGVTNIKGYDRGAGMFLLMPDMNNIEYSPGLKLIDAIKHKPNDFNLKFIESNEVLMKLFNDNISAYITNLTSKKMESWKNNGLLTYKDGEVSSLNYFDKTYLSPEKFNGTKTDIAKMAAMDFVVNSVIANANSFMTLAGDPAMYYKKNENTSITDYIKIIKDIFVNLGKRLANQIAPGTKLANSENEKYLQLFIADRISSSSNLEYLRTILGEAEAESYSNIEAADAQEYTTWKEHLDVLTKLGKTPDMISDITPEEIQEARDLFSSSITKTNFTEKQLQLIGKVMQPIKPVYTGQIHDAKQDVMRVVYIKSSSFPLIPQMTAGLEIDKLRVAMEGLEKKTKMNVRASYQTANKVGSITNPISVWDENGNAIEDNLKNLEASTLILNRKDFRIQQEVPFKSGKNTEDKISLGTQLMKLLFGDEILNYNGFKYNGESYSGRELHKIYNDSFINLIKIKKDQLFTELGLDTDGNSTDSVKSMTKLQSILKDEAVKRGYPLQDIEGLSINENGEFNLPLWASSNSNRYESMLNSIVGNRLVKMKFPGNSYVVGSEEGFKKQEGFEGIDQSKIVWTSAWNGKELQASYHEGGKIKKAQVLVSSKFRDNNGAIIDLLTKVNGEYKYITQTEKGFQLKQDMFDDDLLSIVSFRIPTSGHQSASIIEIAGFLPAINADLMIVPKSFTKQKGLDFDIDKENAYHLWHYMDADGKFKVLSPEHKTAILAKADTMKNSKNDAANKFFDTLFGEDAPYSAEDIADNSILSKANSKIEEKLLQNEIIKIHHSVLGLANAEVQAKITKTLNTNYAESQAEYIESLTAQTTSKYWTPLSDEYQKQKMALGASGKIGTGAYSLDVVFHSLAQQANLNGKPISFIEIIEDANGKPKSIPKIWRFGTIKSDGLLGGTTTLDGSRTVSEVNSERQNVMVDNEKLQVAGKVGLNDLTMDVDKVFNLSRFDKGSDGNSISFLFLSQPIIKKYVDRMKNASSTMAEFNKNKEADIVDRLLKEYDPNGQEEIDEDYWETMSDLMTNQNFVSAIQSTDEDGIFKGDGKLQASILRRFLDMKSYGLSLRAIQTSINSDSKGLGKSFFDVIEKKNALNKLGSNKGLIVGASALIGDYELVPDTQAEIAAMTNEGYINIGDYMVKTTTLSGGFSVNGIMTAYNLWSKYFPYNAKVTNKAFTEVMSIIGNDNISDTKAVQFKQDIFKGIKKYFSSSAKNGIIQTTDNINDERSRLFVDSDDNTSLAKYLKSIKQMSGNRAVDAFIKSNKLINRLEFDIQKNGQPSLIKFNNAAGEEFDEQYLYESLSTLLEVRGKDGSIQLPKIGNKEYTLDTLAQDLIAYAYLGNAIQEAIQFTKYVPVEYLNQVGYAGQMRRASSWLDSNNNILGVKIGNKETEGHLVSEFTMQYVQHNPERVVDKFNIKEIAKVATFSKDGSFVFKNDDNPTFVSVYDVGVKAGKKYRLYWFDGAKYSRIPILGSFGMDEYQPGNSIGISIVNGKEKISVSPQPIVKYKVEEANDLFNINSDNPSTILSKIISEDLGTLSNLAKHIVPFISEDLKIVYGDSIGGVTAFDGYYNSQTNTVTINSNLANTLNKEKIAQTILHEVIHSLTVNQVKEFITTDENGKIDVSINAPTYVSNIVRLYNDIREKSGISNSEIAVIIANIKANKGLTKEDQITYSLGSIYEFMTMAMTEPSFQQYLAKTEYKQSGQTLLDKFKEFIQQVLTNLGVKFDSNTAAAQAINSIFEVIENANKSVNNSYQNMIDSVQNESIETDPLLNKIDKETQDGEIEAEFLPSITELETICD